LRPALAVDSADRETSALAVATAATAAGAVTASRSSVVRRTEGDHIQPDQIPAPMISLNRRIRTVSTTNDHALDPAIVSRNETWGRVGRISYLAAGPLDGPLIVFVHGWPAIAETWQPQLEAFAAQGYRAIAPDMRGYGRSAAPLDPAAYAQEHIVEDMLTLLDHLGRTDAIWVGHDWGCGATWGLAAHHPQVCSAVVSLCIPYRSLERGPSEVLPYVNREVYPIDEYPHAQLDYMAYYQLYPEQVTALFDSAPGRVVRAIFRRGEPDAYGTPYRTAKMTRDGGWFGGAANVPDMPRDESILDETLCEALRESFERNGFAGPTGYYLNHAANRAYSDSSLDNGYLHMPVLFIEARYDGVADSAQSGLAIPMREHCRHLTEKTIDAGHWVGLEKAAEVNATITAWLNTTGIADGQTSENTTASR
jgi:soluble epoxide hydrolase / lipid-phosphate phosphatase